MGYIVSKEPRRVELAAFDTTHIMRELDAGEFLALSRKLAAADTEDPARLGEWYVDTYKERIVRVEGYETPEGQDLMEAVPHGWKDLIPGGHMVLAIMGLLGGSEIKKKS